MTYLGITIGCVPDVDDLRTRIIIEVNESRYSIHPGSIKIYHDLKKIYWWNGMKKDIEEYVAKCPNFQEVKGEHLKLGVLTHISEVQTWKWEAINMDFLVGIPRTRRNHDSLWVIMDRMTMSALIIPMKSTYRSKDYVKLYIL